jgi:hypothetical protein
MKLVLSWLQELVPVPSAADEVAARLALRGFEVASIDHGRQPVIDFEITANRPDLPERDRPRARGVGGLQPAAAAAGSDDAAGGPAAAD